MVWPKDFTPLPMRCLPENFGAEIRKKVQISCGLPLVPILKPDCAWPKIFSENLITDPHLHVISNENSSNSNFLVKTIYGSFDFYHYNQQNEKDDGWGCAYRALQLVQSWFMHQNWTKNAVMSIPEIQKAIKRPFLKTFDFFSELSN